MTFRDAFLRALESSGTTLADISRVSGVSYGLLVKLKDRPDSSTNVDDARKIAAYWAQTVDEFLGDGPPTGVGPRKVDPDEVAKRLTAL